MRCFIRSLLTVACLVLSGCDVQEIIPDRLTGRKTKAEQSKQKRIQAEREARDRLLAERQSLDLHLKSIKRALGDEVAKLTEKASAAANDRRKLSERIAAISGAEGDSEGGRGKVLFNLLGDAAVNELASKYLNHDFLMVRLEFRDRMKEAFGRKRERREADRKNAAEYEVTVQGALKEGERVKTASQKSISELRAEISKLEKRRSDLRRGLAMMSAVERSKKESELNSLDSLLRQLRANYDSVRTTRGTSGDIARADQQSNYIIDRAKQRRKDEDDRIRKRFADAVLPADVATACERDTVGALERVMSEVERKVAEELPPLKRSLSYVESAADGLDGLNLNALSRVRADVDARVPKVFWSK